MSVTDELKKHKEEAVPPPTREETQGIRDSVEFRLGYGEGFHHAMDDSIEIAEEEEDA